MTEVDELLRHFAAGYADADEAELRALSAAQRRLRGAITAERSPGRALRAGRLVALRRRGRGWAIPALAALAILGVCVPAFGVVGDGWFGGTEQAGVRGSDAPVLTASAVRVASGPPTEAWAIVAARSDQGLCLTVTTEDEEPADTDFRLGACGYVHIRGMFPPDVRGDPSAPCIGARKLVPCGSLPQYWVDAPTASAFVPEAERMVVAAAAAAEVASVELILTNGQTVHATLVEHPLGADIPLDVYWAVLGPDHGLRVVRNAAGRAIPCSGPLVSVVVARAEDGHVLGRRVPAWNANPIGDPSGPRQPPVGDCV
jgi:hypothetical protein